VKLLKPSQARSETLLPITQSGLGLSDDNSSMVGASVNPVIRVENLSKRYWLQGGRPGTFQQSLGQLAGFLNTRKPFWALRDISFQVKPGESVGLIGPNGAGKSTLLRLVCGLGRPTGGRSQVLGRVAALLELGVGFHPHLTGRENLMVSAVVAGMRRRDVQSLSRSIIDFAEIEDFIDQPLRTYSSGMQMRLAFSVAVHVDPDVLIVDEALAVGDAHFQQKCLERIESFRRAGKTLLLVSHDMDLIRRFTSRVIWLRNGQLEGDGEAETVTGAYSEQ
jgi:lipopolysaccharide transport system ATP-binding protein